MSSACSRCRRSMPAGVAVPPATSTARAPALAVSSAARTAAMEQAGIVEAGHDGHEGVESRTVFRHPSVTRRAERRQADADRMREGRLRLAASTGRAESQAGPLAVARRAGCANLSGSRARAAAAVAMRVAFRLRPAPGGSGDQQAERPDRTAVRVAAIGRHQHAPLHVATDPSELFAQSQRRLFAICRPRDGRESILQGLGGTPQPRQIEIVMRPVTSAVHERRLRRQLRLLDEGRKRPKLTNRAGTDRPRRFRERLRPCPSYRGVDS